MCFLPNRCKHIESQLMIRISYHYFPIACSLFLASFAVSCQTAVGEEAKASTSGNQKRIVLTDHARALHANSLVLDGRNDMPGEVRTQAGSGFVKMNSANM